MILLNKLKEPLFSKVFALVIDTVCESVGVAYNYIILGGAEAYRREGNVEAFYTKNAVLFFFMLFKLCNRVLF